MIPHGGDVWQSAEELGIPADDLLDFSANVNPRGLPPRALERLIRDAANPRMLALYPDPSARSLRNALSRKLGIPEEAIVIGPGAEALLSPVLRSASARRALVPIPAFSEYHHVCLQNDVEFVPFPLDRTANFQLPVDRFCAAIQPGAVFLNNPHNPSGAVIAADQVREVLNAATRARATLLLDEAFVDYCAAVSLAQEAAANPGLVVIRSLTKFYGCPSLRIGYLIAHPDTARRIRSFLPTWPVTQLAIDALTEAIADREYAGTCLRETPIARQKLAASLEALGLVVFPSAANYLLIELPLTLPSPQLRMRMLTNHRILIRNCDSYEGLAWGRFVRVAVRSTEDNQRLIDALDEELKE
jgi:threonine-phosphate decarboxylase